ncbi:MAG: EamA family transporter [Chitinophagaceae bacterium]
MRSSKSISTVNNSLIPFAFASIFIIWGSTFLAITYGLQGFPPFILSALRFLVAGSLLVGWRILKGERLSSWKDLGRNAIAGILILGGGTGLVAWSEQYVSSSEAAIVAATAPFWFIALDAKNRKQYLADKFIIIGLITGFAGLLLFFKGSFGEAAPATDAGLRITAFVVLGISSLSWVLGSLYSRNFPAKGSTVMNAAQQLLAGGVASMIVSMVRHEWTGFSFAAVPAQAWMGLAFLVVMGSVVAYLSYIWLLTIKPPALVSMHTYINPVVAVLIGWLFMSEMIAPAQIAALGIILAGVLLTNINNYTINNRFKVRIRRVVRQVRYYSNFIRLITSSNKA